MLDPGIVHDDIEPAECLEDIGDHLLDGSALRHVGGGIFHGHAELLAKLAPGPGDLLRIAEPVENDGGPGGRQRTRDAETDAAGRTRYHRHFAIEGTHGRKIALRHSYVHG